MILNSGKHIETIISQEPCGKHDAPRGVACFSVPSEFGVSPDADGTLLSICNKRALKAGFNGKITPSSYQVRSVRR